jgi:hypothetical protein
MEYDNEYQKQETCFQAKEGEITKVNDNVDKSESDNKSSIIWNSCVCGKDL